MTTSPLDLLLAWSTGLVVFVFALAGLSKLGRGSSLLEAMAAMRVPRVFVRRWVAETIPIAEVALATAMLLTDGVLLVTAASIAALLLLVFTALLIGVLMRGDEVDCGCFGNMSADPRVSRASVIRNAVLAVLAVVTAVGASEHADLIHFLSESDTFTRLGLALAWAVTGLVTLSGTIISLQRKLKRIQERAYIGAPTHDWSIPAPAMGHPIPDAEVVSENGIATSLSRLGRGNPVLLLFLSAECSSCMRIAERVPAWQVDLLPIKIRIITSSRRDVVIDRFPTAAPFARYGSLAARKALAVRREPAAVALGGAHMPVLASPVVYGTKEIQALIATLGAK